jgi:hypothetical protein
MHLWMYQNTNQPRNQLGPIVGSAMLLAATAIFLYYTAWTILMVCLTPTLQHKKA